MNYKFTIKGISYSTPLLYVLVFILNGPHKSLNWRSPMGKIFLMAPEPNSSLTSKKTKLSWPSTTKYKFAKWRRKANTLASIFGQIHHITKILMVFFLAAHCEY